MSSQPTEIFAVPSSYAKLLLKTSYTIGKENYAFVLVISLLVLTVNLISMIPILGAPITSVLSPFLTAGTLTIARSLVNKQPQVFEEVFIGFQKHFSTLLPLALILGGLAMITNILSLLSESLPLAISLMQYPIIIAQVLIGGLSIFAVPLMIFKNIALMDTVDPAIKALRENFSVLLITGLLSSIFAFITLIFCLLPIIFVYFPAMLCFQYLVYATIFEGHRLEAVDNVETPAVE